MLADAQLDAAVALTKSSLPWPLSVTRQSQLETRDA